MIGSGDGLGKKVEDLPKAMFKMWDFPGLVKTLLDVKLGPSRPLICWSLRKRHLRPEHTADVLTGPLDQLRWLCNPLQPTLMD